MNSKSDFYHLFTSVIWIFHLSGYNPFVPRGRVKRGGTVCSSVLGVRLVLSVCEVGGGRGFICEWVSKCGSTVLQ